MSPKYLFEAKAFQGHLTLKNDSLALRFRIAINASGTVEFEFDPIPLTNQTKFVLLGCHTERTEVTHFGLSGDAEDGSRFETETLHFETLGENSDASGTRMNPKGKCSEGKLRLRLAKPATTSAIQMRLKGFENFDSLHAECSIGTIAMVGQHSFKDADVITGSIIIEAKPVPSDVAAWRAEAEKLFDHVRRVMSLAASSLLQSPMTEFFYGDELEVTIRSVSRQAPGTFRVIHFLAQEAIFNAAVKSYFDPPIKVNRLDFAIEWLTMEATYNELRLINAMTALENLVDSNLPEQDVLIQSKKTYKKTRRVLRRVIKDCVSKWSPLDAEEALDELNEKLADLNRKSLLRKLQTLGRQWNVPLDDISETSLWAAKRARDKVIHRGQYYEDWKDNEPDLWTHASIVREVAIRFLLTAIGFKGRYISYVGGYHDAEFPPKAVVSGPH